MSQSYVDIPSSTTIQAARPLFLNRDEALRTNFSGTVFPSENLVVGMRCHRTDLSQVYSLKTSSPVSWVLVEDLGKTYLSKEAADGLYQTDLGFTPVQQGGGTGQATTKVYIGWISASTKLGLQVGTTNYGITWPININGNAATATLATSATSADNAASLGGVTPSAFALTVLDNTTAAAFRTTIGAAALASPTFTGTVGGAAGAFTGNFSIGGTLAVTSTSSFTGAATFATTVTVNGNLVLETSKVYFASSASYTDFYGDATDYYRYDRAYNVWRWYIDSTQYAYLSTAGFFCTQKITAYASDKRLKEDIRRVDDWRDILSGLNGYRFKWNAKGRKAIGPACTTEDEIGFLAQEVQAVLPMAAAVNPALQVPKGEDPYLTVRMDRVIPVLVEAVKHLVGKVDELAWEVDDLKRKLEG